MREFVGSPNDAWMLAKREAEGRYPIEARPEVIGANTAMMTMLAFAIYGTLQYFFAWPICVVVAILSVAIMSGVECQSTLKKHQQVIDEQLGYYKSQIGTFDD